MDCACDRRHVRSEMAALLTSPHMRAVFGIAELPTNIPTSAPNHIVAVRTRDAKLAVYSYWKSGGMDIDTFRPIERELYDYSTPLGRQEVDNQARSSGMEAALQALIDHEVLPEVQASLPAFLNDAQEQGLAEMRKLAAVRGG